MFIETQDVHGSIVLINTDNISFVVKVNGAYPNTQDVAHIYCTGNWWTKVRWETLIKDWNWRK